MSYEKILFLKFGVFYSVNKGLCIYSIKRMLIIDYFYVKGILKFDFIFCSRYG